MNIRETLYGIVWYTVFLLCSPIFLLAWIVYRLKGGSKQLMEWILCEARVQGKVRK